MTSFANVEEQYSKCADLKRGDIQLLQKWAGTQKHLPEISELDLILFLHSCHFSNEAAKVCIDNYYTARKHCPEFFANRDPLSAELRMSMNTFLFIPMPKLTSEGYRVYYCKLIDFDSSKFEINATIKQFDMMVNLDLKEQGIMNGHVIVIDVNGITLMHMMKMSIMANKKYMFFLQEALPVRLKAMHYVNAVPFMDKLLGLFKPFMKPELLKSLTVHSGNNETIFNIVSKESLPSDIGGTGGSAKDIFEMQVKKMQEASQFFINEEKLIADETKREGKPKNAGDLFGVEGTFKKLDID